MQLRNARVPGAQPGLVDITLTDGSIVSITPADSIGPTATEESIDLDGRWVSPGMWDNHVHASQWALTERRLDLSRTESAREAASLVADAVAIAASPAPGQPFIGAGFRDGLWPDAPNLADLDAASRGVPVVLVSGDLHCVWLNSAALDLYGYRGHETGLLVEDDAFEVTAKINVAPNELLDGWVAEAASVAARRGVVGIVDLEMDWNADAWQRRMADGFDTLRVEFGIYSQDLDRAIALGYRTGNRLGDLLTVGRFKVLTDGSLNTRTAYCYDDYPDPEGAETTNGMLVVPPADLLPLMRRASDAGLEPTVHAIGDHAISLALDAFEEIGCLGRIEHAQLVSDSDLPRFARLGVTASVQPDHAMDDRDVAEHHWAGRTARAFPLRALLDAGAQLAFGSDAPVSPLDPWATAAAAVGRSRDGREPWHPEQRISVAEALAASTRGTVAVGQVADLIVTGSDPLAASADDLRAMIVDATILAGRFTHRAGL